MEAQQALVRQTITRASRQVGIAAEVQQAVASKGNAIIADVLSELRDSAQFVAITGGGVLLLRDLLADVLAQEAKEPGRTTCSSTARWPVGSMRSACSSG